MADKQIGDLTSASALTDGSLFVLEQAGAAMKANWGMMKNYISPGVANQYSTSSTYNVGDYVIYNGNLYRCTTPITTAETWTAAHWTAAVLGNDVGDLKADLAHVNENAVNGLGGKFNFTSNPARSNIYIVGGGTYKVKKVSPYDNAVAIAIAGASSTGNTLELTTEFQDWTPQSSGFAIAYKGGASVDLETYVVIDGISETAINANNLAQSNNSNLSDNSIIRVDVNNIEQGGFTGSGGADPETGDTTRIRIKSTIKAKKSTVLNFNIGDLMWLVWELSSASRSGGNVITSTGWQTTNQYVIKNDCYIMMAFRTVSSGNISVSDFTDYTIDSFANEYLLNKITEVETETETISNLGKKYLYLSEFVQAGLTYNELSYGNEYRISTKDCVALPYGNMTKLTIRVNNPYRVGIRAGKLPWDLSSNLYWFADGDTVEFNNGEQYYRVCLCNYLGNYNYAKIIPSDFAVADLKIEYTARNGEGEELISRNTDNIETFVNSKNILSANTHGDYQTLPVIVHVSDLHGDYMRLANSIEIANHCNANILAITGDIVANAPSHGAGWMHELLADVNSLPAVCTGNHDVDSSSYTNADVYNYLMYPSASILKNTNGTTYYYADDSVSKLRVIVTDIYEYGATTRSNAHMSSEQLAYIANALATTPSDYGVIILTHTPCVDVGGRYDSNYPTFFQRLRMYGFTHYDISGAPIYDIVDAFIARGSINKTYTQTGSPSSISVSADFSNVPSSVEFIAHLTGHIHEDTVCYLPTTQKQLMLNIACGVSMFGGSTYPYLADDCDITKAPWAKTQDIINTYAIDRTNGTVKITRFGGTKTYDRKVRDYMEIPYR